MIKLAILNATLLGWTGLALIGQASKPEKKSLTRNIAAERGKKALEQRHFVPARLTITAYKNLWKVWGLKEQPKDFPQQVLDRYGFHPAPFPNNGFPMGLRKVGADGLTNDCMLCHGGSIFGKSYLGLGNSTFDLQAFLIDMAKAQGARNPEVFLPLQYTRVRGTVEAIAMTEFLYQFRDEKLNVRDFKAQPMHDGACENVPAWWHLKKKVTMYHDGLAQARSVRSIMQFLLDPGNGPEKIKKEEETFKDVQAFLLSIEPPKYPFPVNESLAKKGKVIFEDTCKRCHGAYGEGGRYPNKIVPLEEIGTDPARNRAITQPFVDQYNKSWFGKKLKAKRNDGYQAPPLDGVWATAPYFHNGSAPTVYHVLKSKERPKYYTRSYKTGKNDYDDQLLGWKFKPLEKGANPKDPPREKRKIYDTTLPGRGNQGHTFGDKLSDEQRKAVIEYLKTL